MEDDCQLAESPFRTPQVQLLVLRREKRMPRRLWNTPEAKVRKLQLQAVRQKKYRARKRAEARIALRNRNDSSSSEDSDTNQCNMSGVAPLDDSSDEEAILDRQEEYPDQGDLALALHTEVVQSFTPEIHETAFHPKKEDDLFRLVRKLAQVKVGSNISDLAMEKTFKLFCEEIDNIKTLLTQRRITKSYKYSLKSQALKQIPPVFCTYYIKKESTEGTTILKTADVRSIPNCHLQLPTTGQETLLRMESYVHLSDIKRCYLRTHGAGIDKKEHFGNCQVSVDGVKESAKGKRTFIIVTMRIRDCIYVYRVFNPLLGNNASKPSPVDILR